MTDHGIEYPESLRPPERDEKVEALLRKTLFVKKLTLTLVAVVLVALVGGGAYVIIHMNDTLTAVRSTQKSNTPISRDTHSLVQYVKDCQAPDGKCHLENLKQTASILGSVDTQNRRVSAAAASCSLGVPQGLSEQRRYRLIKSCVDARLRHIHGQ